MTLAQKPYSCGRISSQKLFGRCEVKLKEAEEKVAAITLDKDGNPTGTTPVEGL